MESAILHGKLGEHGKALHILVHELGDFSAAEDYCLWSSEGQDAPCRRNLFHTLLAMYLRAGPSAPELTVAAVDLLNRHATEFDATQVLQLLPGSWSVQLLCPFLTGAMRDSIHARRTTQVAVGLARSENLIYTYNKVSAWPVGRASLLLPTCELCKAGFTCADGLGQVFLLCDSSISSIRLFPSRNRSVWAEAEAGWGHDIRVALLPF